MKATLLEGFFCNMTRPPPFAPRFRTHPLHHIALGRVFPLAPLWAHPLVFFFFFFSFFLFSLTLPFSYRCIGGPLSLTDARGGCPLFLQWRALPLTNTWHDAVATSCGFSLFLFRLLTAPEVKVKIPQPMTAGIVVSKKAEVKTETYQLPRLYSDAAAVIERATCVTGQNQPCR